MNQKPFAVFDIDGTLVRWQLYHAVADELSQRGHFEPAAYQKVREARMLWKKRDSEDSFKQYEQALVQLVDKALAGLRVADFMAACQTVIDKYKDQVYTYTRDLIHELKGKGYVLFAISASQSELVGLLANYYGFDDFAGSYNEAKDGRFTGKKDVLKRERKPEALRELVEKHQTSFTDSIAVGDSESDIPMLEQVEQPIAFNPTKLLFEHAKEKHWLIVIERKNVVYKLESSNDTYILS